MIPDIHIENWRKNAPWQTLDMIEQDLIISRALVDLYNRSEISENLAFRGGTALNKLHIIPPARYSEDIDLVQIKPGPIGALMDAIRHCLSWLGEPRRKLTERSAKLIYAYHSVTNKPTKLKIEINTTEHFHISPLQFVKYQLDSEWLNGQARLLTYDLHELMATKLIALYQRRKGRDLFDLWLTLDRGLIDPSRVLDIAKLYCDKIEVKLTRALFEKSLQEKCQKLDFTEDISFLLREDNLWHFNVGLKLVYDRLVSQLPGDLWKETSLFSGF